MKHAHWSLSTRLQTPFNAFCGICRVMQIFVRFRCAKLHLLSKTYFMTNADHILTQRIGNSNMCFQSFLESISVCNCNAMCLNTSIEIILNQRKCQYKLPNYILEWIAVWYEIVRFVYINQHRNAQYRLHIDSNLWQIHHAFSNFLFQNQVYALYRVT